MRDPLHQVAVADDGIGVMIHHLKARPVDAGGHQSLGQSHTHAGSKALAQRPGGRLHAGRIAVLGMAGSHAPPLAELFELLQRQVVAGQVEQAVEQHRSVPGRQHKAIAIRPGRISGIVLQKLGPEHVGHIGHAHRQAGVARIGLLHSVHRQGTDGIDTELVEVV